MEFLISEIGYDPHMKVAIVNHSEPQIFIEELTGEGYFNPKDFHMILDLVEVVRKYES